jgi:hypothetical protein
VTYCCPKQALDPLPKGCIYFSSRLRSAGSSQRSGRKERGLGKIAGFSWVRRWDMLTGVWSCVR